MKRFLTFLALCCLMVTGAWAQGNYGPFPNVSGWTKETMQNWIPTSIPQGIVDIQSPAYAASAYGGTQGLVKFDTSATATATFEYSGGNCGAWIIGVELLNPSTDAVVSSCYNKQFTGGGHQRVSYELAGIVADEVYLMRIYYSPEGDVGNPQKPYRDSANGTITWTGSTPTPYSDENEYNVKYTLTDANGNVYTGNFTGATSDNPFSGVSGMTLSNVSYTDSSTPGYDKDLTATVSFPFTVSNGSDGNYVYISCFGTDEYWYSDNTNVMVAKKAVPARTDYEKYSWAIIPEFSGTDVTLKIKNVATGKYIKSTATTQSHNPGAVTLADDGTAVHYVTNVFQFTTTSKYLSVNTNNKTDGYTQNVGAWDTTHNGTTITINNVPFGNTVDYTVTITGATGATVTYGGTPYTSGQTITAENPTVSQLTASEVPGFYPSISIEANTINVTYNLLPFTTGKTYNLTLKGNIVYYDEATGYIKAGNVEDSENTSFIIGGTYADGYTLKSVGANAYLKHENVNNDNAKATTTANESEATRYEYAVKDGYHYFKIRGTANNYVNYRDGYFSSWNNGSALGNDGSRLTFSEPIDPVKGYHIFQNGGTLHTTGSSDYCSQWTSSHANPQISINATDGNGAANDMQNNSTYANDGIVCYTGNNRDSQGYKITLTVAASFGYKITGFQFDASKADNSDYTIDVTAGGTTKTVSGTTVQHFSQTGVNAQEFVIVIKETAGSATHNKPILFNNFYVTYEAAEPLESEYKLVFDNAHSSVPYRIPAVGQTKDGDLIFVADYRYSGQDIGVVHDGKLDLKMRKKYANGEWGEEETLQACIDNGSEFMAFGDPCIVCDRESNSVMVTSCCGNVSFPNGTYENHQGWARWYSSDGGKTWESSFNTLAPQVVKQLDKRQGDQMQAFFIGSGKISQSHIIKKGQYYRLYCASNTRMQSGKCNFVWYSDDFGVTWNLLGSPDVKAINGGDEPKADELPDGSVVISSRDTGRIFNIFHYTDYENAEGYWGTQATSSSNNSGCYGTGCNGEILIVPVMKKSDNTKTYIALQSVPAASDRRNVSIYWKELTDFTKYRNASELAPEWTKFQVSGTTSAYSTMCQMKDGDIAFFYEENSHNNGYDMVYKKFSVEAITDNAYEFYDLNDAAKASEKAAYLTACVGTYFNDQSAEVQALAQAYKADPTMKKYDALNAGFQSPDEAFFTPGLYQIQVGSGTGADHENYTNYYLYAKGKSEEWPIGLTTDATDETTYVYIWGSHDNWHMEFNHGTADSYYAANNCKAATSAASLTFTPNADKTEWKIWGGNQRWMGWKSNGVVFVGSTSTSSTENDNCYFKFTKVVEDIPTAEISLDNTTVTSSQLSELTITFTGDNAAQVQLSTENHTAYLTPKTSTPAQVKAQNGKFKAAPAGAIEGNISATDETGKFSINFGDADIAAGDYELSIPEGTFLVGTTPVPELTANYTVEEPVLEGFQIYENNGDYSNTVSPSSYKDKWLSKGTDPQFTILVTGGGRAVNNMSHNDTYADSGIVCNTGNNSIGYKSTMTVSVQSGYKITGYTFKVKNLDGNNTKVVTTADKAINTTADNQTVVVSNVNADSFTITIDGSTGNYNEGVVFTDFYVTYEGEPVVELPYTITPATINTVQPADLTTVKVMFPTDDIPELTENEMHEYVPTLSKEGEENINATGITFNEDTGEYEITFPTTGMADGTWTLTIPQGTFTTIPATESEVLPDPVPVAEISVAYKVQSIEAFTIQDHHLYTIKGAFADDVLLPLVRNGNSMQGGAESATPQTFVFLSTTHENKAGLAPLYKLGTVEGNGYFTYGGGVGNDAVPMAFLTSSTQLQGGVNWDGTPFKEGYFGMVGVANTNDYRTYVVQANTNVNFNGRYNKNTISGSNQLQGTNTWSFNYILEEITGYTVYDVVVEANGANVSYTGTAGNCLTTTAQGNGGYLVVKSDVDLKPSNLSVSGITSGLSAVINISGTTITISATASHSVPATGYYYIKDTETGKYLYNDCQNCDYTQSGTKEAFDNGYVWHIESQAGVNTITLHNGEGTGYKASAGAEELDHVDVSEKNWEFEEYTGYIVPVEVEYAIFGAFVPFPEAWMTYPGNNNAAHHGGFFTFQKGAMLPSKEDFGYSQNVIGQPSPDGTNWIGAELENPANWSNGIANAYYYSQQDVDRIAEVFDRSYEILNKHVGMPGYCTEVNQDFIDNDETGIMQMMQMASEWLYPSYLAGEMSLHDMQAWCDVEYFMNKYILGRLNDYVQTLELVQPAPGEAFHIAVRGNDYTEKTKYYLKNDGSVTANEEEADVFVMGSTDDTDCNALFVSNNNKVDGVENSGPHYLQNHSDAAYSMSGTYSEENNALKLETMMAAEGKDITNACLYRYGAFSVTGTDGKVITFDEANKTWSTSADHAYMNDIATSAIELIPVEYPYNKPKFAVGSPDDHNGGYASIWLPYPMVFPDGVEAYRATSVENDGILILTKVNENHEAVAAGGYILYTPDQGEDTDPDDAANMPLVLPAPADPDDVTPCEDNVFVGSTENPLEVKEEGSWATFKENYEGTAYVLARKNGVIGYYKYKETETYLPKGKAIWFSNYEPSTSTECMQFSFGDIVEAIKALNGEATDAEIYDLQGHRLNKAVKGQVNVINGKKVMFK